MENGFAVLLIRVACHMYNLHLPLNTYKAGTGVYTCILFFIWTLLTDSSAFFLSESNFQACPKSPAKFWES